MAGRALTARVVVRVWQEQSVEVTGGRIEQPPIKPGQDYQISVRAVGRLTEASEFDNIILKTNTDGTLVRLKDVGHSELGAEDYGSDLHNDRHDAVGIGITQLSNANALQVDSRAIAELKRLAKRFLPGL